MSKTISILASLVVIFAGCAGDGTGTATQGVVLDVRCGADADCPAGYECETEVEHGTEASYCVDHENDSGTCPAGYELEVEHGLVYCKPHGGSSGKGGDGGGHG